MVKGRFVKKTIHEIFDFSISTNSGLTKSFVNSHKGTVPVYGASQDLSIPSYGYIQDGLEGIKYFDDCLTYNKDGASGLVFFRKGHFTISEKVVPLVIFEDIRNQLDCNYLKYAIENESRKQEYTFSNKATKITFKNIEIKIPILDDGTFDLSKQITLAQKYKEVEEKRLSLINRLDEIKDIAFRLPKDKNIKWAEVKCSFLFKPTNGNSIYTKEYCKNHAGDIPLYSGNTEGSFDMVDSFDYDGEYLTWAKDGLAGYMMLHSGKFSLTGHRGIRIPTDNCQNIDLTYIKYVLEPIFRANKKGREGDLGKNEYTTLNSDMIKKMKDTIPIPILDNGSYDIEKQKELAIKYEKLENIKLELMNKIIELTNIVIA